MPPDAGRDCSSAPIDVQLHDAPLLVVRVAAASGFLASAGCGFSFQFAWAGRDWFEPSTVFMNTL